MEKDYRYVLNDFDRSNQELMVQETIFHNANGYLGVRAALEEGYPDGYDSIRGTYLNGFYDFEKMEQAERLCGLTEEKQTIVNVMDFQGIRMNVGGEDFSMFSGQLLSSSRWLDMEKGITGRQVKWRSPKGVELELCVKRMTSFSRLPLFTIEYAVSVGNYEGTMELCSDHSGAVRNHTDPDDPRVGSGDGLYVHETERWIDHEISYLMVSTETSKLTAGSAVWHEVRGSKGAVEGVWSAEREKNFWSVKLDVRPGDTITVIKYCILLDSVRFLDVQQEICRQIESVSACSLEQLYQEQETYLKDYWNHAMLEIQGDQELNLAIHYNMYQMLQSAGRDSSCNIAAKGLSGEGYEGHYFWDTEMYLQPFFRLTQPQISKTLLEYRYEILEYARDNARILGHKKGVLFPWRTIMGKECSGFFPAGTAQYHINGDIAYAVVSYYLCTGDLQFMKEKGAELLIETARLWMDIGVFVDGQFRIHGVTGPDEYTCLVDNNYYTNASAKYNLEWAAKIYQNLKENHMAECLEEKTGITSQEAAAFSEAAACVRLPYDEKLQIDAQDDSFLKKKPLDLQAIPKDQFPLLLHFHPMFLYRHQVCKQADTVLSHFIFEDLENFRCMRRSYEYYEARTTHDSSLSTCIFSIMAAKLGKEDRAVQYFGESAKLDLYNTHKNTRDGIHTANMGGAYMAVVYGFGGLRIKEDGLHFAPLLPDIWECITFKICFHGSVLQIDIRREHIEIRLLEGSPVPVTLYGERHMVKDGLVWEKERGVIHNYKAVIFDLDGVICYTDKYHYEAWKQMADRIGIPFDEEVNNRLRGVSRRESLEIILEHGGICLSEEEKEFWLKEKNNLYVSLLGNMTPDSIEPAVRETLKELHKRGIQTAIGSSSKNAGYILERTELTDMFDAISDGNQIKRSKPYPDVFLNAASLLGVEPEQCLVVEDALSGMEAAHAACMDCVVLQNPQAERNAEYSISRFAELLSLMGK